MSSLVKFKVFDPLTGAVPYWPYSQLSDVVWRARSLLRDRKTEDIIHIADTANEMIEDYFKQARTNEIVRLQSDGQWEYLDSDSSGTNWDIKSELASELDFPTAENTKELDALTECVGSWSGIFGDGEPDPTDSEYFAVMALGKVADVIFEIDYVYDYKSRTIAKRDRKSLTSYNLVSAGDSAITAMEAVCRAETLRDEDRVKRRFEERLLLATEHASEKVQKASEAKWEALQKEEAKQKSEHGKKMAALSLKNRDASRQAILIEWSNDPSLQKLSNAKAGLRLSTWLTGQDLEVFEPRTVAEWISEHKKKAST